MTALLHTSISRTEQVRDGSVTHISIVSSRTEAPHRVHSKNLRSFLFQTSGVAIIRTSYFLLSDSKRKSSKLVLFIDVVTGLERGLIGGPFTRR